MHSRNLMDDMPTAVWLFQHMSEFTHKNQILLTWSLLKWPKYCFIGLIILVWRSMADAYCKTPLGNKSSELDPEAFKRASTITRDCYYTFKVLLNIEHNSSSPSSLPIFTKQPIVIHHNSWVTWAGPPHFSYSYDIVTFWLHKELQFLMSPSWMWWCEYCHFGPNPSSPSL